MTSTLHTDRPDPTPYPAHSQELPAVYSNGPWYWLLSYNGTQPWQKQPPNEYPTGFRGPGAKGGAWIPGPMGVLSEHWAALMNKDLSSGLGVINMDTSSFIGGFSGAKGSGGTTDGPAGYIAPVSQVVIPNKGEYTFSAFFALGTVEDIRDYAYSLRGKVKAQGAEASEEPQPQPQHIDTQAGCAVDEDCELNGECDTSSGACRCDPQWFGPSCGQLRLLPTTRDSGYRGGGTGGLQNASDPTSTWGGSITGPDDSGRWHMFAARMGLNCGLLSWESNSEVVHAVATNPLGPYQPKEPAVVPRFAHNPTVHRGGDGAYYLYHIGCGGNTSTPRQDCTNGTTPRLPPDATAEGSGCDGPHWMGGLTARSPDGPWLPFPSEITLSSPAKADHWLTNPAPALMPNGTLLWVYRQSGGSWPHSNASSERLGIATAASWDSMTLDDKTPAAPLFPFPLEDQYVWRCKRGFYHALTHKGQPRAPDRQLGGGKTPMAGHLFSRDGLAWSIGTTDAPYNNSIALTDGTTLRTGKRARPQLVVKDGAPLYLTTGAEAAHDGDFVFTTVQPIAQR